MKHGQREIVTMERCFNPLKDPSSVRDSALLTDPPTQNSTMSESNSLLAEPSIKHNEIQLTTEGLVVQV